MPGAPPGCCGISYHKARLCADDSVVDLGMTASDALSGGQYFKYLGVCYYFNYTDATTSAPFVLLVPGDVTYYASCAAGCPVITYYRKARKCSDGTVVDIGATVADAAAMTPVFKYAGTCYYFSFADATVTMAPGTLLTPTDVTLFKCCVKCSAGGSCCTGCSVSGGDSPDKVTCTIAGWTACSACQIFTGQDMKVTGDLNGSYCCVADATDTGGTCHYIGILDNPIVVTWYSSTDGSCTGSVIGTQTWNTVTISSTAFGASVNINGNDSPGSIGSGPVNTGSYNPIGNASQLWAGASGGPMVNCAGSYSSTITSCAAAGSIGYGGTAVIVVGC